MKKAFTMIELIFVIVILGILAAVALPKFIGVSQQAHEGNLKAFIGTLNRSVGPSLWSKSISEGKNGDISYLDLEYDKSNSNDQNLTTYTDVIKEIKKIDLGECDDTAHYKVVGTIDNGVAGGRYFIVCKNGDASQSPVFAAYKQTKPTGTDATLGDYNTTAYNANPAKYGDDNNDDKEEGKLLQ